jgi:hypothetical protein
MECSSQLEIEMFKLKVITTNIMNIFVQDAEVGYNQSTCVEHYK